MSDDAGVAEDPLEVVRTLAVSDVFYRIKSLTVARTRTAAGYAMRVTFFVDDSGIPEQLSFRFKSSHSCSEAVAMIVSSHGNHNPGDVALVGSWAQAIEEFDQDPSLGISLYRSQ